MYSPQFILKTDKQKIHEVVLLPCSVEFSHVDFLEAISIYAKSIIIGHKMQLVLC